MDFDETSLLNLDRYLPIPTNKYLLKVNNRNTRKKVQNMFKVNNKDTRTFSSVSFVTLNRSMFSGIDLSFSNSIYNSTWLKSAK